MPLKYRNRCKSNKPRYQSERYNVDFISEIRENIEERLIDSPTMEIIFGDITEPQTTPDHDIET